MGEFHEAAVGELAGGIELATTEARFKDVESRDPDAKGDFSTSFCETLCDGPSETLQGERTVVVRIWERIRKKNHILGDMKQPLFWSRTLSSAMPAIKAFLPADQSSIVEIVSVRF